MVRFFFTERRVSILSLAARACGEVAECSDSVLFVASWHHEMKLLETRLSVVTTKLQTIKTILLHFFSLVYISVGTFRYCVNR